MPAKLFLLIYFLNVHLHHSSSFIKDIIHKEVTKRLKSRFFLLILLDYGSIQIRIRTNNVGSGSGPELDEHLNIIEKQAESSEQCCGSGMFIPIPDPDLTIPDPGSKNSNKREG
jgi:hypothetical protein